MGKPKSKQEAAGAATTNGGSPATKQINLSLEKTPSPVARPSGAKSPAAQATHQQQPSGSKPATNGSG